MTKDDKQSNDPASQSTSQSIDAMHHVGRTLESEEERTYVPKADRLSPQEQAAAESELSVRTVSESGQGKPELKETADSEPLKTRLPGDTSSDPHTDVKTDLGEENQQPTKPRNAA